MSASETDKLNAEIKKNIETNYQQIQKLFDMQTSEIPYKTGFDHVYGDLNAKALEQDGTLDINYHAEYLVRTVRVYDYFSAADGGITITAQNEYDRDIAKAVLTPMLGEHAAAFNKLSAEDQQIYVTSITSSMPLDFQFGMLAIGMDKTLKDPPKDPIIFVDPKTGRTFGVETKTPETQAYTVKDVAPPPILHDGKDLGL